MVKKGIASEFAGGLLGSETVRQQEDKPVRQQAVKTVSSGRKKCTLYLDDPIDYDMIDDILTALKAHGLPRDNSMLVRSLLHQMADMLHDKAKVEALARYCNNTLPNR